MHHAIKLCSGSLLDRIYGGFVLRILTRSGAEDVIMLPEDREKASAIWGGAPVPYYLMSDGAHVYAGQEADSRFRDGLWALLAVQESAAYDARQTADGEAAERAWELAQARLSILEGRARSFLGIHPRDVVHLVTIAGERRKAPPIIREQCNPGNVIVDVGADWEEGAK